MAEPTCSCQCQIHGKMLDPDAYLKVISHDLRKTILHALYARSILGPVTKYELAELVDIPYEKLCYQLNEHLKDFWVVKRTEKVRGTYREYIAPEITNTIYLNIGTGGTLYIIDPLANTIGRIKDVGTRCDQCPDQQRESCVEELKAQPCLQISDEERAKRERVLEDNGRQRPFTPVEYLVVCAATRALEKDGCVASLNNCNCPFILKIQEGLV